MDGRLFGTNGVRGVVNEDMTADLALRLGKAIGAALGGDVAVATDTRASADMMRAAVSSGIMAAGSDVHDLGVLPTPALQHYVRAHGGVKGGVMVTASHNPPQFNGVKYISSDGTEASREEEEGVEAMCSQEAPCVPWGSVGAVRKVAGAGEAYVDSVVSKVDAEAIKAAGLRVCLDCANGAACETTPMLLERLGVAAVTINCNPQGCPGRPSEPTEENLSDLLAMTRATGSDLGIAHDGDADRCVFVAGDGTYVSGDKSLALLSRHALSKRKGAVVTPVSTSSLVEEVVNGAGGSVVYTKVGAPTVARRMIEARAVFGGEENGGLIFPEHQYCRDAGMAVATMLECIAREGPLGGQVSTLPVYHTVKRKVGCPEGMKADVLRHIAGESAGARVDDTDGVKAIFDDGWVLARPSGTEPLFRIFSESKDERVASSRADRYEAAVREYLGRRFD
ncbi:MAG: phosphoglucosamine mutase [Methanomassiliicoccaceae archaeon]|nr:phosphoglucosamine mutase [Methanomassiliicoccaceae archaeon]